MISLLLLGLLLGMRHALEADHLAAVASLATRSKGMRGTVLQGAVWGLGHTLTLLVVGGACLLLRAAISARLAAALEGAVGVMLLLLGADVLLRLRRRRIHLHLHRHDDGTVHLHAHGHSPEEAHDPDHHRHAHGEGFPLRALLVGLVHGLAGSAALLLLTLTTLSSAWLGVAYIAVFGVGSIAGMAVLAAVISLPLQGTARNLTGWYNGLEAVIGAGTLLVGAWVLYHTPWVQGWLS
ncbi:MAG TPA: urease accessory protein [Thermoanaerobaculia bacterium]|nr:urease accessory protein [Thermoanaerobaculia bacterium]